jgi:hypothetical protein
MGWEGVLRMIGYASVMLMSLAQEDMGHPWRGLQRCTVYVCMFACCGSCCVAMQRCRALHVGAHAWPRSLDHVGSVACELDSVLHPLHIRLSLHSVGS